MKNVLAGIVAFCIIVGLGYLFAQAFLTENEARVERLQRHFYDVAYSRVEGPPSAPPRPSPGDLAEPKVRYFQDAAKRGGGTP